RSSLGVRRSSGVMNLISPSALCTPSFSHRPINLMWGGYLGLVELLGCDLSRHPRDHVGDAPKAP
ncbi:unnamed protein product, partial [Ectocarpus sp. 13 AM-2016]